ncbi:MAG: hypothetical protein PHC39_05745 [Proteiniphilum sp.]|jgi:hypothetical protein|nr:hypothetical protein [Proteiniphilum sp.]
MLFLPVDMVVMGSDPSQYLRFTNFILKISPKNQVNHYQGVLKVRQAKAGQIRNCPPAIWTIVATYEDFTVKIGIY